MRLYIVRHAWAEERDERRWPNDADRPLTALGQERFRHVVAALAERDFAPALVVTSPLIRCRQTAGLLRAGLPHRPEIVERDELAPGSDLDALTAWTARAAAEHDALAWVGHAPEVGEMVAALIGQGAARVHMAKGGAAAIDFDGPPRRRAGELVWLVTAKLLGC